ncbi:caspase family protein [Rhizobium bangladeshense]|uniref:Caspase family protein n=1 Tax=Rhizobium bangladeshense TaxID=1138189 RepID=A0ABS7LI89_9HYPH|nr:caspase family protein [Rhizobium bangladeshense]MBX4871497.1 caspase [Rhizobium bangladeshense]MBX4882811.1 caspase [Rhizobium bangladeshense]MBX4891202.1 caspase [Rhizobium bangladeshense]MBX4934775.1 caspase [Rhizobium bangladeshense]MBY3582809.1 caspase family protein [Rhizobium bangladeshense]
MSRFLSMATALVLLTMAGTDGLARTIEAPERGTVRAVLIGIDLYRNVPPLHGAVADAEDLSLSLRSVGVEDITLLKNGAADRQGIFDAIGAVTQRAGQGDLVVLSIAGHGSSEPERVKGSKPSGRDEVYVLAGFDTRLPGSRERIFGDEFKVLIHRLEEKGAEVLFIADTCHAGGMTRDVDPRGAKITWRQAPSYTIEEDDLAPISTAADALSTGFDYKRLTFLAAVDENTKSPEIMIPGVAQKRGALSYATARAFEGAADRNGDGVVNRRELFEYVRQSVYQFTDQRQNIFTQSPPGSDLDRAVVYAYDRAGAAEAEKSNVPPPPPEPAPIAVAALGSEPVLQDIDPAVIPFKLTDETRAELVFDPEKREAIAGGDVVASEVGAGDIPFIVDRMAALDTLKRLSETNPQTVRVTPSDTVHREGERVGVTVSDLGGRKLVLFDVTGDGTVQFLYPGEREVDAEMSASFDLDLSVVAPFGTDLLVAVTSDRPMPALVEFLKQNDRRRTAGNIARRLGDVLPAGARVGFTVLYTSAGAKL